MDKKIDAEKVLSRILKLPKEKQALVVGFIEGVQYEEMETQKEPENLAAVN